MNEAQQDFSRHLWRFTGAVLLALALMPLYTWLRDERTGLAGAVTADMAASAALLIWSGALIATAVGIATARFLTPERALACISRVRGFLISLDGRAFAAVTACVAALAAVLAGAFVFHRQPVLIDATAQLVHARYLAAGVAVAPADTVGFFRILQTVPVGAGWISQYPPLHPLLLSFAARLGAMWLLGPVALGAAVFLTARAVDRLMPQRAAARAGLALATLSPFMIAHAATFMSHTTAAAVMSIALYAAARAGIGRDAPLSSVWVVVCGLGVGAVFAVRPLTGLTVGLVLAIVLALRAHETALHRMRAVAMIIAGALPFVIGVALYNAHFFGNATTFGYDVALGPSAGLGFGIDPWGNQYGIREAFAYTTAELVTLSLQLFEMPLPLVAMTGLYLMTASVLSRAERILAALVLTPLLTNLMYWHHGLFMGPRMLNEYGILWAIVCTIALAGLLRAAPARLPGAAAAYSPRSFLTGAYGTAFLVATVLVPQRLMSYSAPPSRALGAAAIVDAGSLVFVHGGWTDRLAMRLVAHGWRLDQAETALRQNSTCAVQRALDDGSLTTLDLLPRATGLPERVDAPAGNGLRIVKGEAWPVSCFRQLAADSAGVMDPAALIWRGSLPGLPPSHLPTFARDLGPEINASLIALHPDAHVLMRDASGPVLVSYDVGMQRLWRGAAQ
ncbi:MAG: hypothetical protein ABIV28_01695 [Longimicrobiales bacterium]